jgi:hypothetical protein
VSVPCPSTPAGSQAPGPCGAATRPSVEWTTSAPAMMSISGLNRTARSLAVYASQCGLPRHHARLASGRWPSSAGRGLVAPQGSIERFPRYIASPFPKLSWRTLLLDSTAIWSLPFILPKTWNLILDGPLARLLPFFRNVLPSNNLRDQDSPGACQRKTFRGKDLREGLPKKGRSRA